MARNIVPPDGVNNLTVGTKVKRWLKGFFGSVDVANGVNAPVNSLQRSTTYAIGDVVQSDLLHAKYHLVCTTAGTTGTTDPNFAGVGVGETVTDGTAVWTLHEYAYYENTDIGNTDTPVYLSGGKVTSIGATLFSKIVTHLASSAAASISSLNTSSLFYRMLSWALTASGVQYNFSNSSAWYICFGNLFGGLIIQGGNASLASNQTSMDITLPLTAGGSFSITGCIAGTTATGSWFRSSSTLVILSATAGVRVRWLTIN
jgi:hypothetical protein